MVILASQRDLRYFIYAYSKHFDFKAKYMEDDVYFLSLVLYTILDFIDFIERKF